MYSQNISTDHLGYLDNNNKSRSQATRDSLVVKIPTHYPKNRVSISDDVFFIPTNKHSAKGHSDSALFENEAVQYWKMYFNFAYYTLLTPYRFVWSSDTGYYSLHSSRVQKTCQWILCTFTSIFFLLRFNFMLGLDPDTHPTLYFDLMYYFFDTTFLVALFLTFGRGIKLLLEVMNDLQSQNQRFYSGFRGAHKTSRLTTMICIGCLGTLMLQILETSQDNRWSFSRFWQFWVDQAAETFKAPWLTNICPLAFGILALVSSLFEKLLNAFSDVLFTMTCLMFNNLVNSFNQEMDLAKDSDGNVSPDQVLEHYWWIKYIIEKMNTAMNIINGAFIAGNLPFYATNVFEVANGDANIFMRLRYMFYCSYWYPSLFVAAHATYKMAKIKEWICKEEVYAKIPSKKLRVFMHEIAYHAVGVSSYGIVTVTWHTVGSIISVIMSYALMKSQLSGDPPPEMDQFNDTITTEAPM